MRIPYDTMRGEFERVLHRHGLTGERAALCARLFADASRDGVYTHGLNRFPAFIAAIRRGTVDVNAEAERECTLGMLERWDGHRGCGNLNAWKCMERAVELSRTQTIGVTALKNTNHWMRPGNYGLMAAERGCIGILWTNTLPNMPPWGGREARLGNDPLVIALPGGEEGPVLLDAAMSQFSYGKMESHARSGLPLPADGGWGADGQLTRDAADILGTGRALPMGLWKGSGLALMLDLTAACLSGGRTTFRVGQMPEETEVSQVFMAIDLKSLPDSADFALRVKETLSDLVSCPPVREGEKVRWPGQHMLETRRANMEKGIPVEEDIWRAVCAL